MISTAGEGFGGRGRGWFLQQHVEKYTPAVFLIALTLDGESAFLESRKALLRSGSRSRSAADRSMIREWSF